ncbi:MAG: sigma-54 dependent transcriptional regulator [Kiritimatiellaeota bacterium]|nr:sigma-54 dependent transcriptional regulator [Kiritimatiellota bacterium]
MSNPTILIVDDDKNTRDGLQRALQRNYTVRTAEGADAALAILAQTPHVDLMLSDLRMPGTDGLGLLRHVHQHYPQTVCVLLTAYGTVETAVEAMRQGADDFLMKPVNLDHLDTLVARALKAHDLKQKAQAPEIPPDGKHGLENIIGESPAMDAVFDIIRRVAPTQASILIQGASGTGKELVAQAIHRLSTQSKGPFVAVHCAALSSTLLESELFGHEKGAFTGTTGQRRGRFEMADGGTLFLDEISEIDLATQVKLLRVLEERTFERVGGEETITVDIRIVTATNKDLRDYVRQGKFREDLFFRLNVVDILLPVLRERAGDIPLLADRFVKEYAERNAKPIKGLMPETLELLTRYGWPGNVRELRNAIEKMVVLAQTEWLTPDDVPGNIRSTAREDAPPPPEGGGEVQLAGRPALQGGGSLADAEKQKILSTLAQHNDNRTRAAAELGISRRTLHRKLKEWGKES